MQWTSWTAPACLCVALALADAAQMQGQDRGAMSVHGCWQADRPLGPTGGAQPVERDSAFRTLVLRDSGRVALPMVSAARRRRWEERSYWSADRDSVALRVFTGMQGWLAGLALSADGRRLMGRARYLSDAIVVGAEPLRVAVMLTRVDCNPTWPTVATTEPTLRAWQRGQVFFEQQVDRPAALAEGVVLPRGVLRMRPLGFNESARLDSSTSQEAVARVVVQFVLEADGRADVSSVKVLASDGEQFSARVREALRTIRFRPGLRGGVPVHQLTAQRFDIAR